MSKYILLIAATFLTCSCFLKSENQTVYTPKEGGLIKTTYKAGKKMSVENVKPDSVTKEGVSYYFENDVLVKRANYDNNKLAGDFYQYFPNGNINVYVCYDSYGDTLFLREYDKNGNIRKESGEINTHGVLDKDDLATLQTVKYICLIPNVPHMSVKVANYFLHNNDRDTIYASKEEVTDDWIHSYHFKIPSPGVYKYRQETLFIDSTIKKGYRIKDTVVTNFVWQ